MRAHTLDIHCIMLLFVIGYKAPGVLALMGHTYCGILQHLFAMICTSTVL